ncbi:hypothetical protein AGMMS49532_01290 [Endomicrobiia bacterium]|uniref:SPL family radical SAM protein n=1 Tax=Endomicrobium trichonymphae TaxID=1408204 RepID=UPI00221B27DD|nr:hypothetical protein AGMMS49532_01290 [Endomicrobiia bacterium]GMO51302.1 MAG: hypothetical protein Ta2C_00790 [Candidatus Endomicrobium trichonymphae]
MKNNTENLSEGKAFKNRFPNFGVNKSREILRLLSEISKIEKVKIESLLNDFHRKDYKSVKEFLLKRRYPGTFNKIPLSSFYLPEYETDILLKADLKSRKFYPKNIYYESDAGITPLFERVKTLFPDSEYAEVESLKNFTRNNSFTVEDYNNRSNNLFIVKEKYDFLKKCPCTSGVVNCGYSVMNLGMGCIYDCSYCFLQGYQNTAGIIIPYNIEDYLCDEKIEGSIKEFFNFKRIGNGEFTDSLVFDDITRFSTRIIGYFKKKNDIFFEFKTKSANVKNLLESGGKENIVVAWSVNSIRVSKDNEFKTPLIKERLEAAKECALNGFSTAFHFDPIIYYDNWKQGYRETIDMVFDIVPNYSIKWISLGSLRMPATQKTVIENRFPGIEILNGELLLEQGHKLRYFRDLRIEMYKYLSRIIKSKKSRAVVYLCMEDSQVWKAVFET